MLQGKVISPLEHGNSEKYNTLRVAFCIPDFYRTALEWRAFYQGLFNTHCNNVGGFGPSSGSANV